MLEIVASVASHIHVLDIQAFGKRNRVLNGFGRLWNRIVVTWSSVSRNGRQRSAISKACRSRPAGKSKTAYGRRDWKTQKRRSYQGVIPCKWSALEGRCYHEALIKCYSEVACSGLESPVPKLEADCKELTIKGRINLLD
jgi:hypothetical protein